MADYTQIDGLIYGVNPAPHEIDQCLPQLNASREGKIEIHALSKGHYPGTVIAPGILPQVNSIGYFDAIGQQKWGTEMHRNEGIEISYMESGSSNVIIDGHCHPFAAGALSITRPWQLHKLGNPHIGAGRYHWMIIDVRAYRPNQNWRWPDWLILSKAERDKLTRELRSNEKSIWETNKEIAAIFGKLGALVVDEKPETKTTRILIALNELLSEILDLMTVNPVDVERVVNAPQQTVELFLREFTRTPGILELEWTVESMAGHCGLGRSAFTHYCHEITNTSPIDFLNRCRVEEAATRLIENPDMSITQIAFDVGYSSSQYFARRFHARYGVSPRAWRKRYLKI
ncbi:MAG: helix-turn-helix transcriptional regulator [Verrucomicrobiota bacterium]